MCWNLIFLKKTFNHLFLTNPCWFLLIPHGSHTSTSATEFSRLVRIKQDNWSPHGLKEEAVSKACEQFIGHSILKVCLPADVTATEVSHYKSCFPETFVIWFKEAPSTLSPRMPEQIPSTILSPFISTDSILGDQTNLSRLLGRQAGRKGYWSPSSKSFGNPPALPIPQSLFHTSGPKKTSNSMNWSSPICPLINNHSHVLQTESVASLIHSCHVGSSFPYGLQCFLVLSGESQPRYDTLRLAISASRKSDVETFVSLFGGPWCP